MYSVSHQIKLLEVERTGILIKSEIDMILTDIQVRKINEQIDDLKKSRKKRVVK